MNDDIKEHLAKGDDYKSFDQLIEKGIKFKELGRLQEALHTYKEALEIAKSGQDRAKVWNYIKHIHTDRMIAACQEEAEALNIDVRLLNWNKGSNLIPPNYNRPSKDELLK